MFREKGSCFTDDEHIIEVTKATNGCKGCFYAVGFACILAHSVNKKAGECGLHKRNDGDIIFKEIGLEAKFYVELK